MIGLITVDGYQLLPNDRVLVWQNSDERTNGVYNASTGAWVRAVDFTSTSAIGAGTQVYVYNGVTYAGSVFVCQAQMPVVGTSPITFNRLSMSTAPNVAQLPITPGQAKRALATLGYNVETLEMAIPADSQNSINIAMNDAFWPIGGAAWAFVQSTYGITGAQVTAIQNTATTNR
jgi:hypothetical protein